MKKKKKKNSKPQTKFTDSYKKKECRCSPTSFIIFFQIKSCVEEFRVASPNH